MRPKIYTAENVADAMERIRRELGDDAIILSVDANSDGGVRVTAATEDPGDEAMPFAPAVEDESEPWDMGAEIRQGLLYHGVPKPLAERLVRTAAAFKSEGPLMALAGAFDSMFGFHPLVRQSSDRPILLLGPPGGGKTTAVAKIATKMRRSGRTASVITTDTRRFGGCEQLRAFTRILGIEVATADCPDALKQAVAAAETPVIIDTAGTNPFNDNQMNELEAILKASGSESVLVMPAGGDAMESIDIAAAFATLGARRLLSTRLDMAHRIGGVLAAACASRMSLSEFGLGPHATNGLTAIKPVSLARLILPHADHTGMQSAHAHVEAAR